jgi:hypothetical protein
MATTFTKIASVSVGVLGAATIDFTSIPSTYTDLVIKASARTTQVANATAFVVSFNGSTTSRSCRFIYTDGVAVASASDTTIYGVNGTGSTATANTFSNGEMYVPNYASSNNKSVSVDYVSENNSTAVSAVTNLLNAGLWANSAAITSITLTPASGTVVQYSTFTLYGIKNS